MKNKHILVIAPASIPITGAEAICNVKLLRVLSENGYKIDLISKRMKYTHYPETNLAELGLNLKYFSLLNQLFLLTLGKMEIH